MSCHVWINLVLSDIIDYAERNDLAEVGQTLRQTAERVAPLLAASDAAMPQPGGFDLFPLDLRRALTGQPPGAAGPAPGPRRMI